jgi:hypothetical protein
MMSNPPLILRDYQIELVDKLRDAYRNGWIRYSQIERDGGLTKAGIDGAAPTPK